MDKKIIIDSQVMQTAAWDRGMGRYLISLIMGLSQQDKEIKLELIFNKNLVLSKEARQVLSEVAPEAKQHFLKFEKGLSDRIEEKNSSVLNEFIKENNLQNGIFVNGSIFSFDYQPAFPTLTVNACIFYDLIPYKHWDTFNEYFPVAEYSRRFKYIYECDQIFTISETVKNDLINYLSIPKDKITNIAGAAIPHFIIGNEEKNIEPIPYRYVLLPGGDSPHKNMFRAIRAFDEFNSQFGDSFRLVVTSYYSEKNIKKMQQLSNNLILTGNVSDQEMRNLYKNAELILFPSVDEGLGLPLLEAVFYNHRVACSNIQVFKEISTEAFYFFDPTDTKKISKAMLDAVIGVDWEDKAKNYRKIKEIFTWEETAHKLVRAASNLEKCAKKEDRQVSVLVEQAYDFETNNLVSGEIAKSRSLNNVTVYYNFLTDFKYDQTKLPFIFKYFLKCRDISDSITSKDLTKVVVLTKESDLSIRVGELIKARFIGSDRIEKEAHKNKE